MNKVKRFTDFFAGFGAFSAFMYLFCEFMEYDFGETEGLIEKVKFFFSGKTKYEFAVYLVLIALFALSCVLSVVLHRFPQFTLAISSLPMIYAVAMSADGKLYRYPMLYIISAIVHMSGCLYECVRRDREDKGRRAALATDILGYTAAAFGLYAIYLIKRSERLEKLENTILFLILGAILVGLSLLKKLPAIITPAPFLPNISGVSGVNLFKQNIGTTLANIKNYIADTGEKFTYEIPFLRNGFLEQQVSIATASGDVKIRAFVIAAIMFAILSTFRLIHRDLYFIDAALSLVPLITFLCMYGADKVPVFGEIIVFFSAAYAISRITVMFFCEPPTDTNKTTKKD